MIYRNQTSTMTQIQLLAQMRITTVPEAVAFLRAMKPINDQIAQVLQRASLAQQRALNQPIPVQKPEQKTEQKTEQTPPTPEKTFVPEDLSTDEGYSEEETEAKVSKLKAAKSKTQKREEQVEKDKKGA